MSMRKTTRHPLWIMLLALWLMLPNGSVNGALHQQRETTEKHPPPAQEKEQKKESAGSEVMEQPGMQARVFHLQYANLMSLLNQLSRLYGRVALIVPDEPSRSLLVRATPEILTSIQNLIAELDVAPPVKRNIEITAFVLLATDHPLDETPLPDALQPVMRQLRRTFSYKGYRLLDTLIARTRDGGMVQMSGVFPPLSGDPTVTPPPDALSRYRMSCMGIKHYGDEKETFVHIDHFGFGVQLALVTKDAETGRPRTQFHNLDIVSSIDVRDGQMAVVGKTSADGSASALLLVVSAKAIE